MVIGLRTVLECLLHEYMVSPIDRLLESKPHTHSWSVQVQALGSTIESIGSFMADAFKCELVPMSVDDLVDVFAKKVEFHLGVSIDADLVRLHVCVICLALEPTTVLVECLLRSKVTHELVGRRLAKRLATAVHCEDFSVPQPELQENVADELMQELVDVRKELVRAKAALSNRSLMKVLDIHADADAIDADATGSPLAKLYSPPEPHAMREKTNMVQLALKNNIAFRNLPSTFADVLSILEDRNLIDSDAVEQALEKLLTRQTYIQHMYVLENALDELIKENINEDCFP